MTSLDLVNTFRELYELTSNTNDGKTNDEIYIYLNLANDKIVNSQFSTNSEGLVDIKENNVNIDILRTLMKTSSSLSLTQSSEFQNCQTCEFPSDQRYLISVRVEVKDVSVDNNSWFIADWIPPKNVYKYIKTKNNNPIIENPLFSIFDNKLHVFTESFDYVTITDVKVDYIKNLIKIDNINTSELPELIHPTLVNLAVNIALKSSSVEPANKIQFDINEDMQ